MAKHIDRKSLKKDKNQAEMRQFISVYIEFVTGWNSGKAQYVEKDRWARALEVS